MTSQPVPVMPVAGTALIALTVAGSEGAPAPLARSLFELADRKSARTALAASVSYPLAQSLEVATLSVSGSALIVAINALRLKRTRLTGIARSAVKCSPATAQVVTTAPS